MKAFIGDSTNSKIQVENSSTWSQT